MTLHQLLLDLYAPLKQLTDRTVELYRYTIEGYGEHLGHQATVEDFDELKIMRFLTHRVRTRAAATAAKDRAQLRALWEFAARRRIVDSWPTIPPVHVPERVPVCWLTEEMQRLMDSAAQETVDIDGIPAAKFWRALLLLAYDSGERITPMLSLRWRDVAGCNVLFVAETRKKKTRDILRAVSVECADAMLAIKGDRGPDDLVFPWPRTRSYIWKRLEIILQRAGLPHGRKDKFHKIRKTTASYFEAAGGNSQSLLDHADAKTTRKYLDPRVVKQPTAPELIPRVG